MDNWSDGCGYSNYAWLLKQTKMTFLPLDWNDLNLLSGQSDLSSERPSEGQTITQPPAEKVHVYGRRGF